MGLQPRQGAVQVGTGKGIEVVVLKFVAGCGTHAAVGQLQPGGLWLGGPAGPAAAGGLGIREGLLAAAGASLALIKAAGQGLGPLPGEAAPLRLVQPDSEGLDEQRL